MPFRILLSRYLWPGQTRLAGKNAGLRLLDIFLKEQATSCNDSWLPLATLQCCFNVLGSTEIPRVMRHGRMSCKPVFAKQRDSRLFYKKLFSTEELSEGNLNLTQSFQIFNLPAMLAFTVYLTAQSKLCRFHLKKVRYKRTECWITHRIWDKRQISGTVASTMLLSILLVRYRTAFVMEWGRQQRTKFSDCTLTTHTEDLTFTWRLRHDCTKKAQLLLKKLKIRRSTVHDGPEWV